jgi:hypothetical protein
MTGDLAYFFKGFESNWHSGFAFTDPLLALEHLKNHQITEL